MRVCPFSRELTGSGVKRAHRDTLPLWSYGKNTDRLPAAEPSLQVIIMSC